MGVASMKLITYLCIKLNQANELHFPLGFVARFFIHLNSRPIMTDIENIKSVVAGIREGIATGAVDMDSVSSGLNRIENLLNDNNNSRPNEYGAKQFFADKKRREGNWNNPPKIQ